MLRDEAACMTNAVSDPWCVPAIAMTVSPLVKCPPSVAIITISKHTLTPWEKQRNKLAMTVGVED